MKIVAYKFTKERSPALGVYYAVTLNGVHVGSAPTLSGAKSVAKYHAALVEKNKEKK